MNGLKKLTFSAVISAVCVVSLALGSVFPRMELSAAGLAGLFPAAVVISCGYSWAAGVWAAAGFLGLLVLPSKADALLFLCFFGHYPIWKALIESWQRKHGNHLLTWLMKACVVIACLTLMYLAFRGQLFNPEEPVLFYAEGIWRFVLMGAFVAAGLAYDFVFTRLINFYCVRILPRIK